MLVNAGFEAELVYTLIFHKLILADVLYFPITDKTTVLAGHVYPGIEKISPILVIEKLNSRAGFNQIFNNWQVEIYE